MFQGRHIREVALELDLEGFKTADDVSREKRVLKLHDRSIGEVLK